MVNAVTGSTHPQALTTIAEGIAVGTPGAVPLAVVRDQVDGWLLVDEADIEQAIVMLLEIEKTLVEGAGAAGLAALLVHPERFRGQRVGLILCGGNIDPMLLSSIIERGMVRAGRLVRIKRVSPPSWPRRGPTSTRCTTSGRSPCWPPKTSRSSWSCRPVARPMCKPCWPTCTGRVLRRWWPDLAPGPAID
jgi:threonine dehydratase